MDAAMIWAHRGFSGIAPENTIVAAREAFAAGADGWELDVAASSDGELVVIHDDGLERTTDAKLRFPDRSPWSVYDFTLEELRSLDAGFWYAAADRFGQVASGRVDARRLASYALERLPTLREALEFTKARAWKVNVEIKDATGRACDAWIVEKTVALIRELGLVDSVLLSSFNHEYLRRARKADPALALAALVEKDPPDPVALLRELGARALNPRLASLKEATVRALRAAGFEVNVWTVDEPADMRRLLDWGVTGLITDFPDRAVGLLGREERP